MATCSKLDTAKILQSNEDFKAIVVKITKEFLESRNEFLLQIPDISLDHQKKDTKQDFQSLTEELLKQYTINQKPSLIIWGAKSSGKTSFINHFLEIGGILPSGVDQLATRIVKLTYSSPENSYANIFFSLGDYLMKKQPLKTIKLGEFFQNNESSNWDKIKNILKEHLVQSPNQNESEIIAWSKQFIEIGLPSSRLKLGIDFYDTPGFLSNNRDENLNKNLYELIKSIQPTLIFSYVNSSISETDKNCFLSLKQAVGTLENIPIFFLNTQADIIGILSNERINPKGNLLPNKFEKALYNTRQKRYQLLLEHDAIAKEIIGGFSKTIDECDCFDICTIPTNLTPYNAYANLMNERTFERIIQFVARSDSNLYEILVDRVLSLIDEYFDIVLSTTYRTENQWNDLRNEALEWAKRFFEQIKLKFPLIVNTIHENILKLFDEEKETIAIRAGTFVRNDKQLGTKLPPSTNTVHQFVRIAVYEEIMKVAASKAMNESLSEIDKIMNDSLLNKKKKNELLTMVRRYISFWEISGEDLNRKRFFAAILEHIVNTPSKIGRFFMSLRTRPFLDWYNENANQYEDLATLDTYANLFNESKRQEYARVLLNKMCQDIRGKKSFFQNNLSEWIARKQDEFIIRINKGYQYAIDSMEQRKQANKLTKLYSEKFASFECRLLAAKDLIHFNGIEPIIFQQDLLGFGGFFNVYKGKWGDHENLAVKTQKPGTFIDLPYVSYMEAHYHRAITNAHQINVVPLLYLYHDDKQLYIFMPKYEQSLQNYLQKNISTIKFDKILSFSLIIANILNGIHQNDLIHRDIKSSNILLDKDDQCYLSDFGTAKEGTWNTTITGTMPLSQEMIAAAMLKQYDLVSVYDGKATDIFSFGVLLYELLPKKEYYRPHIELYDVEKLFEKDKIYSIPDDMYDYKKLIIECVQAKVANRPTAFKIIERIEILIRNSEMKNCTICLDRKRIVRTHPCGHKVLCQECRDNLRDRNQNLCVLCKKPMQKDIYDNLNQTFYLA